MGNCQGQNENEKQRSDVVQNSNITRIHVVLLGDSVLDNFYWLDDKEKDLAFQLNTCLKKKNNLSFCTNLALDETESINILKGRTPSETYVRGRKEISMENYRTSPDGKFYPLDQLEKLNNSDQKPSHAVLSVGGNDIRVRLAYGSANGIWKSLCNDNFEENYTKAVDKVMKYVPKLILVICYLPGNSFYSMYPGLKDQIKLIAEKVAPIILRVARERKLPVIDLSRTFEPSDPTHYGSTPIEPSNKSSQFICDHIVSILEEFDFNSNESTIYYGKERKTEVNSTNYSYKI